MEEEEVATPGEAFGALGIVLVAQVVLYLWRARAYRSFRNVTLVGLWLFPAALAVLSPALLFLASWILFSIGTAYCFLLAFRRPLAASSPSRVFSWFLFLFRISQFLSVFGYLCVFVQLLGMIPVTSWSMLSILYGLYFGVLSRDFAELCSDKVALGVGFFSIEGFPGKALARDTCCVCGLKMDQNLGNQGRESQVRLNCGHGSHEFCLRGWIMIGKKDSCPYCKEKVGVSQLFKSPWESQSLLWGSLLDAVRYLVVWNPILFLVAGKTMHLLGYQHVKIQH
jgi:RING finger protein 121